MTDATSVIKPVSRHQRIGKRRGTTVAMAMGRDQSARENRLKGMARRDGTQTLTFAYDYAGRRVRKQVTGSGATDRKYIWEGWKLAAETMGDGYTIQYSFVWGPDFTNAQGDAGGAGGLLGIYSPGAVLNYAVPDALGNIAGYLDAGGNVNAAWEYKAFGQIRQGYGSMQALPIGYATQYTDRETEDAANTGSALIYYGYRYYDPEHGRFLNRDPLGEAGGNNLYAFVGNDPTERWDVLGLSFGFGSDGLGDWLWGDLGGYDFREPWWVSSWSWSLGSPGIEYFLRQPWASGPRTRPNQAFNDSWRRDWRISDAIYAAQASATGRGRGPGGNRVLAAAAASPSDARPAATRRRVLRLNIGFDSSAKADKRTIAMLQKQIRFLKRKIADCASTYGIAGDVDVSALYDYNRRNKPAPRDGVYNRNEDDLMLLYENASRIETGRDGQQILVTGSDIDGAWGRTVEISDAPGIKNTAIQDNLPYDKVTAHEIGHQARVEEYPGYPESGHPDDQSLLMSSGGGETVDRAWCEKVSALAK